MRDEEIRDAFGAVSASDELKQKAASAALAAIRPAKKKVKLVWVAAAIAILLVFAIGGYGMYFQPAAYISIDVNPSISLSLNRTNRVIEAIAHNKDAEHVLEGLDLKGKYYEEAIDLLLDREWEAGYLNENAYIVFAVQSEDAEQEQQLMDGTQHCADTHHGSAQAECIQVDADTVEQAHEHGISPGKYQTILELQQLDPSVTVEGGSHMSMHDLKTKIDTCAEKHEEEHGGNDGDHETENHGEEHEEDTDVHESGHSGHSDH